MSTATTRFTREALGWELTKTLVHFGGVSFDDAWQAVHETIEKHSYIGRQFDRYGEIPFSVGELVSLADEARKALYPAMLRNITS